MNSGADQQRPNLGTSLRHTHAAIFEVKFGKKAEEAVTHSRERTVDSLFNDLECVAAVIEGNHSNIVDSVLTATCVDETKKRQLVTRSGLPRLRCLCISFPPRTGNEGNLSCSTVFQISTSEGAPLQCRCHCWRCHRGSIQILQKAGVPRSAQFFSCPHAERDMKREVKTGRPLESRLHIDCHNKNHFSQLRSASDLDCCLMAMHSFRKQPGPKIMRTLEQHV